MPKTVPGAEHVQSMANEGMQKLSSAAKEIGDALGNFGALFGGKKGTEPQQQHIPQTQP